MSKDHYQTLLAKADEYRAKAKEAADAAVASALEAVAREYELRAEKIRARLRTSDGDRPR